MLWKCLKIHTRPRFHAHCWLTLLHKSWHCFITLSPSYALLVFRHGGYGSRVESWVDSDLNAFRLSHEMTRIKKWGSTLSHESIWINTEESTWVMSWFWVDSWRASSVMSWTDSSLWDTARVISWFESRHLTNVQKGQRNLLKSQKCQRNLVKSQRKGQLN